MAKFIVPMDILKLSTDWAKAEVFSAKIVWLFSAIEILTALGFWQLGRTAMAKAFVWPLLLTQYHQNPDTFIKEEIQRTTVSQKQLSLVFRILPAIIILASLAIMLLPIFPWRAAAITIIITTAFLMIVDSNTEARNDAYHAQLLSFK